MLSGVWSFGLCIRYGPNKDLHYDPLDYYDIFKELLTVLIEKGKGIEINTRQFV